MEQNNLHELENVVLPPKKIQELGTHSPPHPPTKRIGEVLVIILYNATLVFMLKKTIIHMSMGQQK